MSRLHGKVCARVVRTIMAGLVGTLLVAAPFAAAAADAYRDISLALGQGLLALFPAVEGLVVSSSGGQTYVDVARKDLVKPGMEMQVYRPGAEMVHPVTRQVLGSYEQDLGVLSLTEVRDTYSRGTLDAAGAAAGIVPGDRVRISARRLRTLLHLAGSAPGIEIGPLAQALVARAEQSGRFAMIDEPAWAPFLTALGSPWETVRADPVLLRRLGELASADLLLAAQIASGASPGVVIEVRSLRTGTVLGELSERWPAAAAAVAPVAGLPTAPPQPLAVSPAAVAAAPGPGEYVVRELAAPARCLAAGDLIGEGRLDVVLSDGARISLFRWEGEKLAWKWDEAGRGGRRVLSLDAADLDGDGRTEVLVTAFVGGRVTSELRRWQDGALRTAASIDGVYLRAAPRPGAPTLLFGQSAGFNEVLSGRVEQYRLNAASFEPVERTALPTGVGIFGLALAPQGGPVSVYSLDRDGILSGRTQAGKILWSSGRPYGGYPPPLTAAEFFGLGAAEEQSFDEEARAFQGRLLAEPSAGGVRLVVPRNFSDSLVLLPRLRARGHGEVVILAGPPESLEEVARSRTFDGYVADLARGDIDGDGSAEFLFVVNVIPGLLSGERGKLVAWRPAGTPGKGN